MNTSDQSVYERVFVGAARWAGSHYGARRQHYTISRDPEHPYHHYAHVAWLVLNAHYFGRGDGWAGTHDDWDTFLELDGSRERARRSLGLS